jgi:hypothetical protein
MSEKREKLLQKFRGTAQKIETPINLPVVSRHIDKSGKYDEKYGKNE